MNRWENQNRSEIDQVQDLIRNCPFKNKVFTLDALHSLADFLFDGNHQDRSPRCQKQTVQQIMASGNQYLIPVKKNQKKLDKA